MKHSAMSAAEVILNRKAVTVAPMIAIPQTNTRSLGWFVGFAIGILLTIMLAPVLLRAAKPFPRRRGVNHGYPKFNSFRPDHLRRCRAGLHRSRKGL